MTTDSTARVLDDFARTTDEIFSLEELRTRLDSGKQLRIKYGVDVTARELHIGHAVNLWMMRRLQDDGHKVVFLIGDFTTRIGDPTGKSKTRPVISREEIDANAEKFIEQARMVLRFDDPELLEIRRNSEWLDPMSASRFLELLSMVTHARLISRDMFRRRIEDGTDIYMHEMLYPILQGYDSWALDSDLTIIGSDQLFNEMLGRFYQERLGQEPQVIITTPITPGIDGGAKQSKSLGNYVGLSHSPRDKFGRLMRVPDDLVGTYMEVYTGESMDEVHAVRALGASDPLEAKKRMACAIVARYHGAGVAAEERAWFEQTFSQRQAPTDMPVVSFSTPEIGIIDMLVTGLSLDSKSEARRLIQQGGVRIDGDKVEDVDAIIDVSAIREVKVGKRRWFKAEHA